MALTTLNVIYVLMNTKQLATCKEPKERFKSED